MRGFERHFQLATGLALWFLQAIELPVCCHAPATGRRADLDPHSQKRGVYVDTSSPQQTHSDRSVEATGSYNAALDLIHTALRAESEGERYTGMLHRPTLAFAL